MSLEHHIVRGSKEVLTQTNKQTKTKNLRALMGQMTQELLCPAHVSCSCLLVEELPTGKAEKMQAMRLITSGF